MGEPGPVPAWFPEPALLPDLIRRAEVELAVPPPAIGPCGKPVASKAIERTLALLGTLPSRATSEREAELTIDVFALGLDDVPVDLLRKAVVWAIKNCRWRPTVAELREAVATDLAERRRRLARLRQLAALPAAVEVPKPSPEERDAILKGFAELRCELAAKGRVSDEGEAARPRMAASPFLDLVVQAAAKDGVGGDEHPGGVSEELKAFAQRLDPLRRYHIEGEVVASG
ncbi:MAG: hypothetical protein JO290_12890 [Sphingomonadaceae bacterium]|nr:hypothetical protein [Sphingomonadaceae bacterium]